MADSVQVFPPNFRVLDSNGDPASGAKIYFDDAGTTDDQTTYSDDDLITALPNPIICDSGGRPTSDGNSLVNVYVGTSAYKCTITDSDDVQLYLVDNQKGAIDTSSFGTGSAVWSTPVNSETSDFSATSAYYGDLTSCDPTGATFTVTLESAVTAGNGTRVGLRHDGTANEVKIATVAGQTLKLATGSTTTAGYTLTRKGHMVWLVSDGAGWTIDVENRPIGVGIISITDRLTSPPSSAVGGARYILNGAGTGDWASYSEHDVLEADGQGGWIQYTPQEGWLAFLLDERVYMAFKNAAWEDQTGMAQPSSSNRKVAIYQDQKLNGTDGGTATSGSRQTRELNTEVSNTLDSSSLASNAITLGAGSYKIKSWGQFNSVNSVQMFFKSTTTSKEIASTTGLIGLTSNDRGFCLLEGTLTLTESEAFELQYQCGTTAADTGLGNPSSFNEGVEIYAQVTIEDLATLQGPDGSQGPQGPAGPDGPAGDDGATGAAGQTIVDYTFDSSTTTDGDPGSGFWRSNNATPASVTEFYVDDLDRLGVNQSTEIATWDDSTSSGTKAKLYLEDLTSGNRWTYNLTGVTANSGYLTLAVTHSSGTGSFASNNLNVVMVPRGDKGTDGAGAGDVVGPASSVDGEIALFDSTTGKLLKRAGITGLLKAASGVLAAVTAADIRALGFFDTSNDGSGSGLDADLLDGNHSSAFATAGHNHNGAYEPIDAEILRANTDDNVTAGYTASADDDGTQSSGTYTPSPSGGNLKRIINGGAFTLAAPSATNDYTLIIQVTNNASAGTITTSGFEAETGDSLTTTNSHDFFLFITKINNFQHIHVVALQ